MEQFKSPIKLPDGNETNLCYYPLKLDTYGCGCSHNCLYCYAKTSLQFRGLWDSENAKVASLADIKKLFRNGKSPYLKHKMPIRLGGMTDCFGNNEKETQVTRKVIEYLNSIDYPYLIITKNALVAEYIPILSKENCIVQITITTEFGDVASVFEPGASSPAERLAAGSKLAQAGIYTAARINPLFPIYPDGVFSSGFPTDNYQALKYFTFNLPQLIADAGFKTIIAGFVRLSTWNLRWINDSTNESFKYLFDGKKGSTAYFSIEEIHYYYERIKGICDANGVQFTVCYDNDANYEAFRYLWANPNDCCNNFRQVPGFANKFDNFNPKMNRK